MALGGGSFTSQNKVLPGTYINFVSSSSASGSLSERGFASMPLSLDWGVEGEIFTVTNSDFIKNSKALFGYDYSHSKLTGLRDLFLSIHTLYAYRLNSGDSASCEFASARYSGERGNDLLLVIASNIDDSSLFDVETYLDNIIVDIQTVSSSADLVDNDYLVFEKSATLSLTAGIPLSGGSSSSVAASSHQDYLDKIESYSFNTIGLTSLDDSIKQLYVAFTKRMRDEVGVKFQLVLFDFDSADYEGVINLKNSISDEGFSSSALVYWVTGIQAGCPVNKSCLNRSYNGEFSIVCNYTQSQLASAISSGQFLLHKVSDDIRVLSDINSLVSTSAEKGDDFKENQVIRVLDQIANDIAFLFNSKYLGVIPNDHSGRISLWTDIVKHHENLQSIRAIENFSSSDIVVEQGDTKKSVVFTDNVQVVNTMAQVYMTVTIS